jgi:hypothetical protein
MLALMRWNPIASAVMQASRQFRYWIAPGLPGAPTLEKVERHDDRGGPSSDTALSESLRALAKRYGINQATVATWKGRSSTADLKTGPCEPRSSRLSIEEEAIIVAFRQHSLLPLDDCLHALQATIPHPTRSSLHCCRPVGLAATGQWRRMRR